MLTLPGPLGVALVQEGGEEVPDLRPAAVGGDGAGGDLPGLEVPHQLPQLGQGGVVGVADSVVAAALRHRDQPVVPRSLQRGHLGLGEVHCARLDLAHLQYITVQCTHLSTAIFLISDLANDSGILQS